ncbi:MAG: PilZ domain-containing protein [Holophagaceae bacterium]|nr:PilZ domain-containing protein [Holophagaceae bacterium]
METPRRYPRISVVDGHVSASLRVKDKHLAGIRVTSLSLGGLFLFIDTSHTAGVVAGRRIEDLILHHPDLPATPMSATVMRTLGGGDGMDIMGCGLRFDSLSDEMTQALGTYIESCLKEHEEPFIP